jgi:hypothetical protein
MTEDEEFAKRAAEEREFRERFRREQAKRIKDLQRVVDSLVTNVVTKPNVLPAVISAPAPKKQVARDWELYVDKRERGMMQSVVATCNGQDAWRFDIERFRDGYVKRITARRV